MQPGDLVVSLLISEIAAMPIDNIDRPLSNGVIAVFFLVFLETALACISLKSGKVRRAINGAPALVINRGQVDRAALKRLRITTDDLLESLRGQGVFDISTVQYAIVEPNGQLSVLQKSGGDNLAVPVICDGKFQTHFMESVGISRHEVNSALKKRGITADEVFIMTLDSDGKAFIVKEDSKR